MTNRAHNVPNSLVTWIRFKELFNQKYFPEELRNEKESEFLGLTQGSMSLVEYERKFEQWSRFALYLIDTEQRKINRFVGGLKSYIQKHVHVLGLMTYADMLQKAQILAKEDEITINTKPKEKVHGPPQKKPWNKNFQGMNDNRNHGQKRQMDDDVEKKRLPICGTCGKKHRGIYFRKIGACFKCGKPGHFIQNCPELKKDRGVKKKDQKTQGRVYVLTRQEVEASPSVVPGIVPIS
ncbi:hypothetical protein LWI28_002391 [Acer negundo]|uniref:CCHC-type domain-containing protein n=1 Tax=Acer negundo TaxID=4023 RepID=A0AAD5IXJ9_ACENE|nr:hypothetical protein LWI28_002391 [Acer negundo]